jgi:hypothetical protein
VSTLQLFVNGIFVGTTGSSGVSIAVDDILGAKDASLNGAWGGGLAQLCIYNAVLSSQQLAQLYSADANTPSAFPGIPVPQGYYGLIKPTGIPKINANHPLAAGLVFYAFDTGLGYVIDLVSGTRAINNSNSPILTSNVPTAFGQALHYNGGQASAFPNLNVDGGATSAVASAAWAFFGTTVGGPTQFFTGMFEYDVGGFTAVGYLDCEYINNFSGNQQELRCFGPSDGSVGLTFQPGNTTAAYLSVAETMDGTTISLYGNGTFITSHGDTDPKIMPGSNLAIGDFTGYPVGGGASPVLPYTGNVFYWGLWNRTLSSTEAALLAASPYCFLISPDQNFRYPGAVQPQSVSPRVLLSSGAFPGTPFPNHLSGKSRPQNFLFPGALQPLLVPPTAPVTGPVGILGLASSEW